MMNAERSAARKASALIRFIYFILCISSPLHAAEGAEVTTAPMQLPQTSWIGNSFRAADAIGSADPIAAVTSAAQQLAGIVEDLADAGAVDIVVPTLINVGWTPQARQAGDAAVDQAGQLSTTFNQTLAQELAGLAASSEVNLIRPDFFALLESITASPASFGLTKVTDACLSTTPLSVTTCADPDQYLFWDQQHPTTAGHALFANLALDAITAALDPVTVPEPWPTALMAPLLLVGWISLSRRKAYP